MGWKRNGGLMGSFWKAVAKLAAQVAIYAAGHPDQVIAIVNDVQKAAK